MRRIKIFGKTSQQAKYITLLPENEIDKQKNIGETEIRGETE